MSAPLWQPDPARIAQANLTAFLLAVQREGVTGVTDYAGLYRWSIERPEEFWPSVWRFCRLKYSRAWDAVVTGLDRMPGACWFPGARLNFAENLLSCRDDRPALVSWTEAGRDRTLTYADLYRQTAAGAATLRSWGIRPGDRVAAYLPNLPEAVVGMLAASSIGAVWSSTSPDFGRQGVLDRFGQIEPRVLFAADRYRYNDRSFDCHDRVAQIVASIPSIEHVVLVRYPDSAPHCDRANLDRLPNAIDYEVWLDGEPASERPCEQLRFEQLPFDHPLYILYSSGTTGMPKCIVHGAGGTLLQHVKELVLHTDLKPHDRILYYTTCGWMMWNWLVSSLAVGATVVLYDGSPFVPQPSALFDLAQAERLNVLGVSAKYLMAAEKAALAPARTHDLSALRTVLSTGSPLSAESFEYVYREIKTDVCLSSISGGTDIVSCFALGNPTGPVYPGELQTRGLGMKVEVFDDAGQQPLRGKQGELVCTMPFPSMPIGFWNDPTGEKYRTAYFNHFPGVWRHGDYVELTEHDGMVFHGRSDAVLNPGGVRIGTAEIYRQVEQLPEVLESVAVGQEWQGDTRVLLFVKLRPEVPFDQALAQRIKEQIRRNCTARHVPEKVLPVSDIPRTISGKIVELAIRDVIHGRPVRNREALANPEALLQFENMMELRS